MISGNHACKSIAAIIQSAGFEVKAILSPTVLLGKERLRICLHAQHTQQQMNNLLLKIKEA